MRGRRSIPWNSIICVGFLDQIEVNNDIINKISWLHKSDWHSGMVAFPGRATSCVPVSLVSSIYFHFFAIVIDQLIKIILHIFISLYAIYIFISCYAIVIVQWMKITPSIAWRNALPIYSSLKYSYPHVTLTLYTPTDQCRLSSCGATSTSLATQTRHESDHLILLSC